ncbi:hypothetical protein [Thermus antranikianii]|uniref:hypothetical protein n=1 Tax=Thermus antranikianii TaxID=88190 RepID=UPI0019CB4B2C|nr:hypothetical protein [Thermus antranikianii]QWK21046.1 MAG: hypothetical protein KNN15_08290 [Thermus antranikianii]
MAKNKASRFVLALAAALMGLAMANASDSETYTVNVPSSESVTIETPGEPDSLTVVDYYNSGGRCSTEGRFCTWYPTIKYSTNHATNRKLVAKVSNVSAGLSVILEKQTDPNYANPYTLEYGTTPGSWAFLGSSITLSDIDQDIVIGIQNGSYAVAPIIKLQFASYPAMGTYSATVAFTIMAQ